MSTFGLFCEQINGHRYDWPIRCRTLKPEVNGVPSDVCDHPLNLTGRHGNVPWATTKQALG